MYITLVASHLFEFLLQYFFYNNNDFAFNSFNQYYLHRPSRLRTKMRHLAIHKANYTFGYIPASFLAFVIAIKDESREMEHVRHTSIDEASS